MLALQQLSLLKLWGRLMANSYAGEGFDGGLFGLVDILVGQDYGLFLYHPWYLLLLLLNIAGLWLLRGHRLRAARRLCGTVLLSAVSLWGLNGAWGFEGDSFGSRAFIELLPPLSLGAAIALQRNVIQHKRLLRWRSLAVVALLGWLNLHLWLGYLLQRYAHGGDRTLFQAYFWPIS